MAPLDNDTESTICDEIFQEAWAPEITHQAPYRYVLPSLRRNSITRLYLLKIEINKKTRYDDVHKQIMVTKRKRENHGSCSRCNENTWHIESNYILQPSKYLLLIINRFRYTNNNVTKDRCSILMNMTVMLGPLKFSPRATINHHGPSIHSGHYTINCCKETFYYNDNKITEFEIIISKIPLLYML